MHVLNNGLVMPNSRSRVAEIKICLPDSRDCACFSEVTATELIILFSFKCNRDNMFCPFLFQRKGKSSWPGSAETFSALSLHESKDALTGKPEQRQTSEVAASRTNSRGRYAR